MAAPAQMTETTRVMVQGWRTRRDDRACVDKARDGAGLLHKER
jgi:hypothetical protein